MLKAGLLVGTLDLAVAFAHTWILSGTTPDTVLKFVASLVFGPEAFAGGWDMAVRGLLLHFGMVFAFTGVFFKIYPKVRTWITNWILLGVVYGLFIWAVMQLIVVPLSNTLKGPFNLKSALIDALILIVCIGLPLAFIAKRQEALPPETSPGQSDVH